jgi:hypothetical protein
MLDKPAVYLKPAPMFSVKLYPKPKPKPKSVEFLNSLTSVVVLSDSVTPPKDTVSSSSVVS